MAVFAQHKRNAMTMRHVNSTLILKYKYSPLPNLLLLIINFQAIQSPSKPQTQNILTRPFAKPNLRLNLKTLIHPSEKSECKPPQAKPLTSSTTLSPTPDDFTVSLLSPARTAFNASSSGNPPSFLNGRQCTSLTIDEDHAPVGIAITIPTRGCR